MGTPFTMISTRQQIQSNTQMNDLGQQGRVIAEYIWIDGACDLRGKARTLQSKPAAMFPDPFRRGDNILVLTETFVWEDTTYKNLVPSKTNFRHHSTPIFDACKEEVPWYGIE